MVIMRVMGEVGSMTVIGVNPAVLEIEVAVRLVFILHEHVAADDGAGFEVAAAVEAFRVVDAAGAIVDGGLRIGAERTGAAGGGRGRAAPPGRRPRRGAIPDPIPPGGEGD